jgi:hypothetical protein
MKHVGKFKPVENNGVGVLVEWSFTWALFSRRGFIFNRECRMDFKAIVFLEIPI